ncbi:hypothetical protein Tco_1266623 [Tanacetum coccineum]
MSASVLVDSVLSADFWFHPRILPLVRKAIDAAKSADGVQRYRVILSGAKATSKERPFRVAVTLIAGKKDGKEPAFFNPPEDKFFFTRIGENFQENYLRMKVSCDYSEISDRRRGLSLSPGGPPWIPLPPLLAHFFDKQAGNDQSPFAWRSVSVHATARGRELKGLAAAISHSPS